MKASFKYYRAMQHLISLLLIIFQVFPNYSYSQSKGDNSIVVKGVGFKDAVTLLLDKGFSIEKIDSNFQTFTTGKKFDGGSFGGYYWFDLRIKGSDLIIKGKCETFGLYEIEYGIRNGKFFKLVFQKMWDLAKSFEKEIYFKKTY